ncbi:MAG: 4Fe-4S binding protein [Bacteroidetes bacterium]|nr:4Fe-4S binding protein [Bacteroidota bacterium]
MGIVSGKHGISLKKYLLFFKNNIFETNIEKGKLCVEKPDGKLYKLRTWVSLLFFLIFACLPFVYYKGKPFILLNFFKSEFIIYGQVFEPGEFYYFGLILILFAAFILLFTTVFGRVFCGWFCPQTVLMEMLFRKIEYLFDRKKDENKKYSPQLVEKTLKILKQIVFYILSFIIANIILSYIIGFRELVIIINGSIQNHITGLSGVIIFSIIIYCIFAFLRQKACINFCPYSRLQNVLFDKDTLLIAYDYKRGEPRGVLENDQTKIKIGECTDCLRCIKVCPMAIDIRNGIQRECIMCTSCIDECNSVMGELKKQKGLILFTTENMLENGIKPLFHRRIITNLLLMILVSALIFIIIFSR